MTEKERRAASRYQLEQMVTELRDGIRSGRKGKGQFLPSELSLSKQYKLSKNTVRKGLDVLVAEQLVEKVPYIGTRIVYEHDGVPPAGEVERVGSTDRQPIRLKLGHYYSLVREVQLLELVKQFRTLHPDIEIETISIPHSSEYANVEQFVMQQQLDLVTVNPVDLDRLFHTDPEHGGLTPLDAYEGTYPFLAKQFERHGKLYAQSFVFSPVVLCYNKTHFRSKQLPEPDSSWTWEHVRETGKMLAQGSDRCGFYFPVFGDNRWPLFLLQKGVVFGHGDAGQLTVDAELLRQAAETCRSLVMDKQLFPTYLSETDNDAIALFRNEKVSMILASYLSLNDLRDLPFEYDVAPCPSSDNPRTLLLNIGLGITAQSPRKEAARKFLAFLMSYEAQLRIRRETVSIPSVKLAAEWTGEELVKHPYRFHLYREIMPSFCSHADLGISYRELIVLREALKLYWLQFERFEDALARIEEAWPVRQGVHN